MPVPIRDLWDTIPALAQDLVLLGLLLAPAIIIGAVVTAGFRTGPLVRAMLWRFRWTNLLFVVLIGVSVGIGVGLLAQERGLRQGTARAAAPFDLVLAAPGSEVTMLLATVYLQPSDVPLLGGAIYDAVAHHPRVSLAAPIAFGDSVAGAPVVGTVPAFVEHLSGGLSAGRMFSTIDEAVAGALAPVALGDTFEPTHGLGDAADEGAHAGTTYTVVGTMPRTGSPWDRAVLVPVESVWVVHGLASGHGPDWDGTIGPPFDEASFPGTPAILVRAEELWANYALRSEFTRDDLMAFFPGAVLAQLHNLLGDVRQAMSLLAIITQVLVTAGVLTGLVVLTRLSAQRLALLRAIGAPARFVFAVVWRYAATLIVAGAVLGGLMGFAAAEALSRIVTAETGILVTATLRWPEIHLIAAFVSVTVLLALLPPLAALSRDVVNDLRS